MIYLYNPPSWLERKKDEWVGVLPKETVLVDKEGNKRKINTKIHICEYDDLWVMLVECEMTGHEFHFYVDIEDVREGKEEPDWKEVKSILKDELMWIVKQNAEDVLRNI